MNDVSAIFNKNQDLPHFIPQLKSFYPSIKFTSEIENENCVPFLFLNGGRNNSDKIQFDIYKKTTCNYYVITNDSHTTV